ncbi:hypothetical protein PROFUN_01974 [Planoprotostelium fungivorum]|uniref:SAP domain-containing protein n=1 Tax=Planoprotostelium fungivorum TaxID=1890364 RepID=A0A2P6NB05_9EUKA|nr:hypothetical protein PROFUN_01974 [Planoprotostelium fungivorum]
MAVKMPHTGRPYMLLLRPEVLEHFKPYECLDVAKHLANKYHLCVCRSMVWKDGMARDMVWIFTAGMKMNYDNDEDLLDDIIETSNLKAEILKRMCPQKGMSTEGTKIELAWRILGNTNNLPRALLARVTARSNRERDSSDRYSPMNKKQLAALCKDRNIKVGKLTAAALKEKLRRWDDRNVKKIHDDLTLKDLDIFLRCRNRDSAIFCHVIKMLAVQAWTLWLEATFNDNINLLERTIEHFIIQLRSELLEGPEQ